MLLALRAALLLRQAAAGCTAVARLQDIVWDCCCTTPRADAAVQLVLGGVRAAMRVLVPALVKGLPCQVSCMPMQR